MDRSSAALSAAAPSLVTAQQLERWRDRLIDLSRRNPMIALAPERQTQLALDAPSTDELFDRLARQRGKFRFWLPPEPEGEAGRKPRPPRADEIRCDGLERRDLLNTLTLLYRRGRSDFLERGLRVLKVVFGMLEWPESPGGPVLRSPLVVLPVVLNRPTPREPFTLSLAEDEPVVNPALQLRLARELEFQLPALGDTDADSFRLSGYLDAVDRAISEREGFRLTRGAVLTFLSFDKGVIHADLTRNAEAVMRHPLVRALAGDAVTLPRAEPPAEADLDAVAPAEARFSVLDADASQRRAVELARSGASFVLIGPPGTGKSQTIANLIADRLACGKTVLFVSAKMAALEVVQRRLRQAGLGDCCLEVHSQSAQPAKVVQELFRTLHTPAPPVPENPDAPRLAARRAALDGLVRALHTPRMPLGLSVSEALERLSALRGAPRLELGPLDVTALDRAWLDRATDAVRRLARLTPLLESAGDSPWRWLRAASYTLTLRDDLSAALENVRRSRQDADERRAEIAAELGFADVPDAARLREAAALRARPPVPPVPSAWWAHSDLDWLALGTAIDRHAALQTSVRSSRRALTDRHGPAFFALPVRTADAIAAAWDALKPVTRPDDSGVAVLAKRESLRRWADATLSAAGDWRADADALAAALDIRADIDTPGRLRLLAQACDLLASPEPPELDWLAPAPLSAVEAVVAGARAWQAFTRPTRERLLARYAPEVFLPERAAAVRDFMALDASRWRWFSGAYRDALRRVRLLSRDGRLPQSVVSDLRDAGGVREADEAFRSRFGRDLGKLGKYAALVEIPGGPERLAASVGVARSLLEATRGLGLERVPPRLAELVATGSKLLPELAARAARLRDTLDAWERNTDTLSGVLVADAVPGVRLPAAHAPLPALCDYARSLLRALGALDGALEPILHRPIARPTGLRELLEDLRQADVVRGYGEREAADAGRHAEAFGGRYAGLDDTDWADVRRAYEWADAVRRVYPGGVPAAFFSGPLAPGFAGERVRVRGSCEAEKDPLTLTLSPAKPGAREQEALTHLDALARELESAESELLALFRPDAPRHRLDPDRLAERLDELPAWFDWAGLPGTLDGLGLGVFFEEVRQRDVPPGQLPGAFERAFLTAWADAARSAEPLLRDFRGPEHERRAAEFADLDRAQLPLAGARVLGTVAARRPATAQPLPGSEVEALHKQALIKVRHRPLRQLFAEIPTLLPTLKPCLLMSPLSVSQVLAEDRLRFDTVIFDEASQIPPEDAVGAIYRGAQVVVVGDDQQLPPSDFFQLGFGEPPDDDRADTAEATYSSVLDQCRAVLPSLALRWHYRSRDESLIAFSNHAFYEGRLVTFPAAEGSAGGRGVSLEHVPDGVYDRGGRRVNRREAEVVADRVFEQLRARPDQTVGVIAFSQAQMRAIEDQLERRRRAEPDLEDFFRDDRLEGVFVRNLETVQGDERDVIFLSVGYGRDASGRPSLNFGPLNRTGGERRLNVAVTRARERLVVVSSIRGVDLGGAQAEGVRHLRRYLDFAESRGRADAAPTVESTPSPGGGLWDDIAQTLAEWGFESARDVGASSGRVDLAVRDPERPGRFLLGLLGDGPRYRDTPTARDRDRLRPEVLAGLGWSLHRVWSLDWLTQRDIERRRLREALDSARSHVPTQTRVSGTVALAPVPETPVVEPMQTAERLPGTVAYPTWAGTIPADLRKRDFADPEARPAQLEALRAIVAAESPIHTDVLTRRLTRAWGVDRLHERHRKALRELLAQLEPGLTRRGEFLWADAGAEVPVRVPAEGDADAVRTAPQIPPEEWRAALVLVAKAGVGTDRDALLKSTVKAFGLRLIDATRELLDAQLRALLEAGMLREANGRVGVG